MNADTSDEFDVLQAELKDDKWKKEFSASAYDQTQNALKTSYNAFVTGQDAAARATLESAETRTRSREAIPEAEMKEIMTLTRNARSPAINARAIRLADQQRLLRVYGNTPPAQIEASIAQMRGSEALKTDVAGWASAASRATGGEVTASYLVNKLQREYPTSALEAGNYGVKAGTSSAKGLFQFTDGTWREMFRKYGPSLGIDVAKYTDAQMLAKRDDPAMSTMMAALYAKENKQYLRSALTTEPNDVDLYMAHFLGPQGAVDFIKAMRAGPNDPVAPTGAFKQAAIDANKNILQGKTYKEVYDNFASSFMPGVSGAQFDQIDYLSKMREDKVKAISDDPITSYVKDGRMASYELDSEQAFVMRGRDALSAASYYSLPVQTMKPFTGTEANNIAKALQDGDANSTLQIMAQIQAMDKAAPGMARAAFAQLGEKDTVLGYAAELAYDYGDAATAAKIVRGQKSMKADGASKQLFGTDGSQANAAFYSEVENALSGVAPEQRAAIFDAAKAHYADSNAGKGLTEFDSDTFAASVRAVLGSDTSIGEVNGHKTLMPPGLNADDFSDAIDNMDDGNLVAMSRDKLQPIDMEGNPITATDIAGEGQFVAIGGGYYKIMMADGGYLSTGKADPDAPYNMRAFIFTPDVGRMKWLAGRTNDTSEGMNRMIGAGVQ